MGDKIKMDLVNKVKKTVEGIIDVYEKGDFQKLETCLDEILERFDTLSEEEKFILQSHIFMAIVRREVKPFKNLQAKAVSFLGKVNHEHLEKTKELLENINKGIL